MLSKSEHSGVLKTSADKEGSSLNSRFEALMERFRADNPKYSSDLLQNAYTYASMVHQGQFRKSHDPYMTHPLEVAMILADFKLDDQTIAASLLHDVIEETPDPNKQKRIEEIREQFGDEILNLVLGVTKLSKLEKELPSAKSDQQTDNLASLIIATAHDIRVILIKMADRLHNMRTLQYLQPDKQKKIAEETLTVFAPLAHRLGMGRIRWELEDLAFKRLHPDDYEELVNKIAAKREDRERYLKEVMLAIELLLKRNNLDATVMGRAKHFYSIWRKMLEEHLQFDQVMDLHAVRVIVNTVPECYAALGYIHTVYKPLFERFKDYIGCPKSNYYQSLHTTVIGPKGQRVEIQIRTWEMHHVAEFGIAAHWLYKEGRLAKTSLDEKVSWLREIIEFRKDSPDNKTFINEVLVELYRDEVFVFTPKGDIVNLPAGSTPVDFAYKIHTDIGHKCRHAIVNGKPVPLHTPLKNGDIVNIITAKGDSDSAGPNRDWLNFVQTPSAKEKIRAWMRRVTVEDAIKAGKESLEIEQQRMGLSQVQIVSHTNLKREIKNFGFKTLDELYFAIGRGDLSARSVIDKLREQLLIRLKEHKKQPAQKIVERRMAPQGVSGNLGILVDNNPGIFVRLARCCQPIPGDSIVGFTTKGRGVSIHTTDCPQIQAVHAKERLLEAKWRDEVSQVFYTGIDVFCLNRTGILSDITQAISDEHMSVNDVRITYHNDNTAKIELSVSARSTEELNKVLAKIRSIPDIIDAERARA